MSQEPKKGPQGYLDKVGGGGPGALGRGRDRMEEAVLMGASCHGAVGMATTALLPHSPPPLHPVRTPPQKGDLAWADMIHWYIICDDA